MQVDLELGGQVLATPPRAQRCGKPCNQPSVSVLAHHILEAVVNSFDTVPGFASQMVFLIQTIVRCFFAEVSSETSKKPRLHSQR